MCVSALFFGSFMIRLLVSVTRARSPPAHAHAQPYVTSWRDVGRVTSPRRGTALRRGVRSYPYAAYGIFGGSLREGVWAHVSSASLNSRALVPLDQTLDEPIRGRDVICGCGRGWGEGMGMTHIPPPSSHTHKHLPHTGFLYGDSAVVTVQDRIILEQMYRYKPNSFN